MGCRWMYPWCRTTSKYSCPAADLIGKRPVKSAEAQWVLWRVNVWLWRGGLTGAEETGAKAGMKERSGGVLLVPLSFLVFLVCGEELGSGGEDRERRVPVCQTRGAPRALKVWRPNSSKVRQNNRWFASSLRKSAERQDEGGTRRVDATPFLSWSR